MIPALAAMLVGLMAVSSAAAADFTWSGAAPAGSSGWSTPANWVGGVAPSNPVGTLVFPALTSAACAAHPPTATCYASNNDIAGLSVNAISIDDGSPYAIAGNAITLGGGGITASTTATCCPGTPSLSLPVALGASQRWSIDGNLGFGQLQLRGDVTGPPTQTLGIDLSNQGSLLVAGSDVEVGPVTISGPAGGVTVGSERAHASLNASDAQPVSTAGGASLVGFNGTVGPLTVGGAGLLVLYWVGQIPGGTFAVNGPVTLTSNPVVRFGIHQAGTTAGTDYSELSASGAVSIASTPLEVDGPPGGCPALHPGDVYTLITTTGALTGTFVSPNGSAPIPDGATLSMACSPGTPPQLRINYTAHTVTATVLGPGAQPTLSVLEAGSGAGSVTGSAINCPGTCAASYPPGTTVTLTATPAAGSTFTGWSGGGCGGTGTCTVTMSSDQPVTATFAYPPVPLTVLTSGSGSGSVTGSGISCPGTCSASYPAGSTVTLSAAPAAGSTFTGWAGGGCGGTGTCTVTMSSGQTVTATFTLVRHSLSVALAGSGTVTGSGISCPGTCAQAYPQGTTVVLTATPAAESTFGGWSGGGCTGAGTCTVRMSSDQGVTATFTAFPSLTVSVAGAGTVTGGGINCPGTCSHLYPPGTAVTLTATPASGSAFQGWAGDGSSGSDCGASRTRSMTVASAQAVTATFAASADFTWCAAATDHSGGWSNPSHWVGGSAPGGSVGTLTFPPLPAPTTCAPLVGPSAVCGQATNDLIGLSVDALSVAYGSGSGFSSNYSIGGNAIALGRGGLTVTTGSRDLPSLDLPIALAASQVWSIDGTDRFGSVVIAGSVTGPTTDTLGITLSHLADVTLKDVETGPLAITGADPDVAVSSNGTVILGTANSTDGQPVTLTNAKLYSNGGAVGPLTVTRGDLDVSPAAALVINGSLTLDAASALFMNINHHSGAAGIDYSKLRARGPVNLGNAHLLLGAEGTSDQPGHCPALTPGDVITLVLTTGPLTGTFAGLPNGAAITLGVPDGCTAPATVRINYTAHTVTATVPGAPAHAVCDVAGGPNVRVNGIEVTQGVQTIGFPDTDRRCDTVPGFPGMHPAADYPSGHAFPADETPRYVRLVAGRKTVVRVYATTVGLPDSSAGVAARLYGYRGGQLIGSSMQEPNPQEPDDGNVKRLGSGTTGTVEYPPRIDPGAPFQFTIPHSWTSAGDLTLVAEINPPDAPPVVTECADCQADNVFMLNQIHFVPTRPIFIRAPAVLSSANESIPPPPQVFSGLVSLLPVADGDLRVPTQQYDGYLVGSESLVCPPKGDGQAAQDQLNELTQFAAKDTYGAGASVNRFVGIYTGLHHDAAGNACQPGGTSPVIPHDGPYQSHPLPGQEISWAAASRPLTSVAHEIFHGLGLPHAGSICEPTQGDQAGANWPADALGAAPDEQGFLQGVGLDIFPLPFSQSQNDQLGPRPRPGHQVPGYDIKAPPRADASPDQQLYDIMSYCIANVTPNRGRSFEDYLAATSVWERITWESPRSWNALVERLLLPGASLARAGGAPHVARAARAHAASGTRAAADVAGSTLHVTGVLQGTGAAITAVIPGPIRGTSTGASSSRYRLVARNAAGGVLAEVGMEASSPHVDFAASYTKLEADVPATGVHSVQIVSSGRVLAERARSAHAPQAGLISPRQGARVGGCAGRRCDVTVVWRASDADHGPLRSTLDYSADGGRRWRTIFIGSNRHRFRLPAALLTRSTDARVRIRVNDGFNETTGSSARFASLGAPPAVQIVSPVPGLRIADDASAYLSGQARDDADRRLAGRQLRWYVGRKFLGSGATISPTGLPPGARSITLVARDRYGRRGTASVEVRIVGVKPQFLLLKVPAKIRPAARIVRLMVASVVPAVLKLTGRGVSGRRFAVARNTRDLTIHVRPGHSTLHLAVRLTAYRRETHLMVQIVR